MEISSTLSTLDAIFIFTLFLGATYLFILSGLYYFTSGKGIFPIFWTGKDTHELVARWNILLSLIMHFVLLFGLWVSSWGVEIKIIITALYVLSTTWIFYIAYKKYKLRISKIDTESKEQVY